MPLPTLPTLGGGFTLGVELPSQSFNAALCCKVLQFSVVTPPIPLGSLVFNPAVIGVLNAAINALNAYHDAFVFNCPLE
jgi:hypothetical protein